MTALIEGFAYSKKKFDPVNSPDGFEWPYRPSSEEKKRFHRTLLNLVDKRGLDMTEFSRAIFGEVERGGAAHLRDYGSPRKWLRGELFPREKSARVLACFFDVSLAQLLGDKLRANGNGHDHSEEPVIQSKRARREPIGPPPRLPLPEGAKAPTVKMETFPTDARFVSITVEGTLELDVALSLMALLAPRREHVESPVLDAGQ